MKLKYERFEGLGCLYVRGPVDEKFGKLLQVGLETISKDLEETLVVNLVHANMDPAQIPAIAEFKKKLAETAPQKVYWIMKDRGLGDFPTIEAFITRLPGAKSRQIGERIKADDDVYIMTLEIQGIQAKITQLGGDEDNVIRLIMENTSLKEQKRLLEAAIKAQMSRAKLQVMQPSKEPEIKKLTDEAYETLKKNYGKDIDL